jgi:hypothetical protein
VHLDLSDSKVGGMVNQLGIRILSVIHELTLVRCSTC